MSFTPPPPSPSEQTRPDRGYDDTRHQEPRYQQDTGFFRKKKRRVPCRPVRLLIQGRVDRRYHPPFGGHHARLDCCCEFVCSECLRRALRAVHLITKDRGLVGHKSTNHTPVRATYCPRAASRAFIQAISASWAAMISSASLRVSVSAPCSSTTRAMATAPS